MPRFNRVSWMSLLGLLMFVFLAEAGESMETRVRRVSAYYVAHYAAAYRIPVGLVEAVIEVESAWRPEAVSDKGGCGLMQLMPGTSQRLSVSNPFNIEQNIRAGAEYLSYLSQLFNGDLRLVLAAYAAGERRVQQRGLAYSHPGVLAYVLRVRQVYAAKCEADLREGKKGCLEKQK